MDVLKGCNCAYLRDIIGIPIGLRGNGAEVANDMAMSLFVRSHGSDLIYDPDIVVDHYPGVRLDEDVRNQPSKRAELDAVYNVTYAICSTYPSVCLRYRLYHLIMGHRYDSRSTSNFAGVRKRERRKSERVVSIHRTVREAIRDAHRQPLEFWIPSNPS